MRISDWSSDVCSSDLRGHASQKGGADRRLGEQHGQCAGLDLEKAGSGHGRRHRDEADRGEGDAGDRQSPGKLAERQQPGVMPLPFPKPIEAEERKPEEQSQIAIKREARSNRSEEHTSELQSLMRISYAVFCLKKKNTYINITTLTSNSK